MKPLLFALLFVGVVSAQDKYDTTHGYLKIDTCGSSYSFYIPKSMDGFNYELSYQFARSTDSTKVIIQDKTIRTKENPYLIAPVIYTVQLWDEYKKSLDDKYNKRLNEWAETINIEMKSAKIFHLKRTYSITIDEDGWTYIETGNDTVDTFKRDASTFEGFIEYLRNKK